MLENRKAETFPYFAHVNASPNSASVSLLPSGIASQCLSLKQLLHLLLLYRIYEYFLGKFGLAEGQKSRVFFTPKSIASLAENMTAERKIVFGSKLATPHPTFLKDTAWKYHLQGGSTRRNYAKSKEFHVS